MQGKGCSPDEVIITQGEAQGDYFYVVERGIFDVEVDGQKVAEVMQVELSVNSRCCTTTRVPPPSARSL